jgi:CDP-diacylglycerol--serine O-phosphatidyltransferase
MISRFPIHPNEHGGFGAGGRRKRRRRRSRRGRIPVWPTMFTLANLVCGFLAIFFASRAPDAAMLWKWTPLTVGAVFIFLGMVFDALDGRVARLTQSQSGLGEQLDSMADMVTFGAAPAFLVVQLTDIQTPFLSNVGDTYFSRFALIVGAIYAACAALRLARFNVHLQSPEGAQHVTFTGLPSPAAAGTVASLVLLHQDFLATYDSVHPSARGAAMAMVGVTLLAALAMISRLVYPHVVNRYLRGRARVEYVARLVVIGLLLAIHLKGAVALGFFLYALSAPYEALRARLRREGNRPATTSSRGAGARASSESAAPTEETAP